MTYGWMGTILRVNLTNERITKEPLDKQIATKFLGGRGLNGITLFRELKAGIDPLSAENVLLFGMGPCNGTLSLGSGRYNITAKSPMTGGFGDSNSGGFWGPELKYAGYDQIIIEGKAEKPVYLWIDGDEVEIRNAEKLWGRDTFETEQILKEELEDPRIQMLYIGQAGENLVKFANVMTGLYRAAGRTGMGSVMGSKNLKAIAVRGNNGVQIAHPDKLQEAALKAYDILYSDWFAQLFSEEGSPCLVNIYNNQLGALVTRNFQAGVFEGAEKILGKYFDENYKVANKGCFSCPLHCGCFYMIKEGPFAGLRWGKAEFATIINFTSRVGVDNIEVALRAGILTDKYGIDLISMGGVLGFAFECYEKGILTAKDTDGLKLEWGNGDAVLELVRKVVFQEGLGKILSEGVKRAAEVIGKGSEDYAIHTKGLEHIECDPRGLQAWGLGYAVSSRGADHLRALPAFEYTISPEKAKELYGTEKAADRFSTEGKGKMVKWFEELRAFADSMEICKYITRTGLLFPEPLVEMLNAVTGMEYEPDDAFKIGERIVNVERAFNVREGFSRKDDTLPKRFLEEPLMEGPSKGHVCDLEPMLDDYYKFRGWDVKTGLPTRAKLEELGLSEIALELQKMGKIPPEKKTRLEKK